MHYHYVAVIYTWVRVLSFILKKTPCISLTQGRKKYETSDRQTDDGAWEKQSIRKAQVSYPPIQKKNPKNEQTIKPITTTFPEKTFCFVILVA